MKAEARRYALALKKAGVTITREGNVEENLINIIEGTKQIGNKTIEIAVGTNGCMRVLKPNGKVKYYYEKSPAQVGKIIEQIIKAYR